MKREDLKARGMTDENIDFVLDEFHKEQEDLKGQVQTLTRERDEARDGVKKYQQGGEFYQDPTELEGLRKFKADTEAEKEKATKDKAFDAMLENLKVKSDMRPLLKKNLDYSKLVLTDKGEVSTDYEKRFSDELKAVCPTAFDVPPNGTGIGYGNSVPNMGANGNGKPTAPTIAEWNAAIAAKTKI